MNKKLIALALAGAFAAPVAMAQTANPVTLYGALRIDIQNVKADGGTAAVGNRTRIIDHPSLIGVRGTEDLGGGLKAWFQLETGFESESVSGTFGDRNSGVGLQGGWGSFLIGRWDMPMKTAVGATDLWGDINMADYTAATMDQGNFSVRAANVVQYWSPNWGGFAFRLAYVPDENRTGSTKPTMAGASVTFTRGPLYLVYAYEQHKGYNGGNTVVTTSGYKEEGNVLGGSFTMGIFKLSGHYGEYKKTGVPKDKSFYVGGQITTGNSDWIVTYQNADEGGGAECDAWGAGWQYNFSRRTKMRLSYADIKNDGAATCNFGAGGALGTAGQDPQGFGLTMLHYF